MKTGNIVYTRARRGMIRRMAAHEYAEVLGQAVKARRRELGLARAQDLADVMGVSVQTVNLIEASRRESYSEGTLLALDRALAWDYGAARRTLATGAEPLVIGDIPEMAHDDPMVLNIPPEAIADLTPADIAELKSAAQVTYLERAREIRMSRGGGGP